MTMTFDITVINDYIMPIALVAALCVGFIVKNLIPSEKVDNFIPLIVAAVGVVVVGFSQGWTVEGVVAGMVSGLASTGLYEAFAQIVKARDFAAIEANLESYKDEEDEEVEQ